MKTVDQIAIANMADRHVQLELTQVPMGLIDEPRNAHRQSIDNSPLMELAKSMQSYGLMQPITLMIVGNRYEIIAGHRRYLAAVSLGWLLINAVVTTDKGDANTETMRAIENLQREQLSPLEESKIVYGLWQTQKIPIQDIARTLHRSHYWVEQRLSLSELPPDIEAAMIEHGLAMSHALELTKVTDEPHRRHLLSYAVRGGVSINILRQWISDWQLSQERGEPPEPLNVPIDSVTQRVVMMCDCTVCNDRVAFNDSTLIRICKRCAVAVQESSKETRPTNT